MCGDQYNMLHAIEKRENEYRNPSKQEAAITRAQKSKRKQHIPWNKISKTRAAAVLSQHEHYTGHQHRLH